jgi:hypothetical protein
MKFEMRNSGIWLWIVGVLLWLAPAALGADQTIAVLQTRTVSYTNVTVTAKNPGNIFIRHAGGAANIKLQNLEPEVLESLGYAAPATTRLDGRNLKATASRLVNRVMESAPFKDLQQTNNLNFPAVLKNIHADTSLVVGVLAGLFVGYLFFSLCCMLICRKTGNEPGLLVWLPLLQVFPLLRAAGMSGWWFFVVIIPVLNLVALIPWCFNIVKARAKSMWWVVCLILPVTNLLAFLYLAFSSAPSSGAVRAGAGARRFN